MSELLTRENAAPRSIDPTGKHWVPAKTNSEQGMWMAAIEKDGKFLRPSGIPDYLEGSFTKAVKVQVMIDRYISEMWDKAEEAERRNARPKREAAAA